MERKTTNRIIWTVTIGMIAVGLTAIIMLQIELNETKKEAKKLGIEEGTREAIDCYEECEKLEKEYFRYKGTTTFTQDECWCREGKETRRIY